MRQDVTDLRQFYASPLGKAARDMVAGKLAETWGDASGLDELLLGYATPFVDGLRDRARRVVAAMPAAQGVEAWPAGEDNRAFLADEAGLALPNALFDRILAVHALEESDDPLQLMRELARVLAPSGRLIVVVTARHGLWADAENTPFGHGRPTAGASSSGWCGRLSWSRWGGPGPLRAAAGLGVPMGRGLRGGRGPHLAAFRRTDPDGGHEADLRRPSPWPPGQSPPAVGAGAGPGRRLGLGGAAELVQACSAHKRGGGRPMKMIVAVIKPSRLDAAIEAVTDAGVAGLTVTEVRGYGRQKGKTEVYRGAEYEVKLLPKVKLEIAVTNDMVAPVMEAIARAASTGKIGDGKIFVLDLEQTLRVRTGERDAAAIGG